MGELPDEEIDRIASLKYDGMMREAIRIVPKLVAEVRRLRGKKMTEPIKRTPVPMNVERVEKRQRLLPLQDRMGDYKRIGGIHGGCILYVKNGLSVFVSDVDGRDGQKWRVLRMVHPKRFPLMQEVFDVRRQLCGDVTIYLEVGGGGDEKSMRALAPHEREIV